MSLGQTPKPDKIDLVIDGQYSTSKAKRVAQNLKEKWEGEPGKNFNKIAADLGVSDGLVRKVYYQHFGKEGSEKTFEEEDEEIEELIEKYRSGEFSVEPKQEYLEETVEDVPIEKYNGKGVGDVLGDPIDAETVGQLISDVYSIGFDEGEKSGFKEGMREMARIMQEDGGSARPEP